jgi:hypothetical protein
MAARDSCGFETACLGELRKPGKPGKTGYGESMEIACMALRESLG